VLIYVDADACPVKKEVEQVATRHGLNLIIVSNGGIRPSQNPIVQIVVVDKGPDEADKYIANAVNAGDIVVTADIPLAARVIENGGRAIKHNGKIITENNIGDILAMRDLMTDLRSADPFAKQNHKQFSKSDKSHFLNSLEKLIQQSRGL
tara:strand:+ start:241 stop:690 length:450 start_codon:yes stop_codon:yes gene_type:complete